MQLVLLTALLLKGYRRLIIRFEQFNLFLIRARRFPLSLQSRQFLLFPLQQPKVYLMD